MKKNTVSLRVEELIANKLSKDEVFLALKDHEPDQKKLAEIIFDFPVVKSDNDRSVFRANYYLFLFFLLFRSLVFAFTFKGLLLKVIAIGGAGIWYELSRDLSKGKKDGFLTAIWISLFETFLFLAIVDYEDSYLVPVYILLIFFVIIFMINLTLGLKYHGLKLFKSGWNKKQNTPNF